MLEKRLGVQIEIALNSSSLEEEFFHSIAYMVQQFACTEDAKKIQKLFDDEAITYRFIGKSTKIIPLVNVTCDSHPEKE